MRVPAGEGEFQNSGGSWGSTARRGGKYEYAVPTKEQTEGALSIRATARTRPRFVPRPPAETADTSVQGEQMTSEAEQAGRDPTPTAEDAGPANKSGTAKDALDWLDDAIREIVELNHAPADHDESDAPFAAPYSPSITPMHDESDDERSVERAATGPGQDLNCAAASPSPS